MALPHDRLHPHPDRLDPATPGYEAILAAHREAVERGEQFYRDPESGLEVMTALALWERGYCCDLGCRHCPWIPRG